MDPLVRRLPSDGMQMRSGACDSHNPNLVDLCRRSVTNEAARRGYVAVAVLLTALMGVNSGSARRALMRCDCVAAGVLAC